MGNYTAQEHIDLFGGLPERGEAIPDFDAIRDRQKQEGFHHHRDLSSGASDPVGSAGAPRTPASAPAGRTICEACGAPADEDCAASCEANR